jgi:hypothetical protein
MAHAMLRLFATPKITAVFCVSLMLRLHLASSIVCLCGSAHAKTFA